MTWHGKKLSELSRSEVNQALDRLRAYQPCVPHIRAEIVKALMRNQGKA